MSGLEINWDAKRRQLIEDGYCLVKKVLSAAEVAQLCEVTNRLVAQMSEDEARAALDRQPDSGGAGPASGRADRPPESIADAGRDGVP